MAADDLYLLITSHAQLTNTVQRLDSHLGSTFVYSAILLSFGTRDFILLLQNRHYLEAVYTLIDLSSDSTQFIKVVSRRSVDDSELLTWVVEVIMFLRLRNVSDVR
jgi:hypothetical protein